MSCSQTLYPTLFCIVRFSWLLLVFEPQYLRILVDWQVSVAAA
jgi:hypothetical protein